MKMGGLEIVQVTVIIIITTVIIIVNILNQASVYDILSAWSP